MIERVQRRATKIVRECKSLTYTERLAYLQLHSLKGRRTRGDLIQTYKIMNGVDDVDVNTFFSFPLTQVTRNSEGKLYMKHSSTNRRKYCFSNRVIFIWNSLPTNIKFAQNVNSFKNYLDSDAKISQIFNSTD